MSTGMIFNIQRFSIYDGPGARTTVFFKGCNLNCKWCHNPESISAKPMLEFFPDKCIGCGKCFNVCPQQVHGISESGEHFIDRSKCIACMKCVDTCYAEALVTVGEQKTSDQIVRSLMLEKTYYEQSGGGVTFSGGECMQQIDFLADILKELHAQGIHTAVDTAGNQPWERFERILEDTDLFLYDLKAADSDVHKKLTGVPNERIIENLKKLSALGKHIWIRIPYIPGRNSGEIDGMIRILKEIPVEKIEIMPFHRLGEGKYKALGLEDIGPISVVPKDEEIASVVERFRKAGLNASRS